ncbi:MAG: hypothetical protein K0R73_1169 [Candidatus Midichloriaceae bacterium]|jgi:uncharacterized protein (DUF2267 family)|nr:hypothetical protein [Candidatus Midichloriaceae bacterium]
MSTNLLKKNLHKAYVWLHEIDDKLDIDNLDAALAVLRIVLHEIRDHIPIDNSAHLSAQLPTFIRGLYYEGWKPSAVPIKDRTNEEFERDIARALSAYPGVDPVEAVWAVYDTLCAHINEEEIAKVLKVLPKGIRRVLTER